MSVFSLSENPTPPNPTHSKTKQNEKPPPKKISKNKNKTKQRGVANPGSITIGVHLLINILSMMETNAQPLIVLMSWSCIFKIFIG